MTPCIKSIYKTEYELLDISKLELALKKGLIGISLSGLPLRTRSKVVKEKVCLALGYPIPKSFTKSKPRFPCQNLDILTQKSNNIQIWNEGIDLDRRYAVIRINSTDTITDVKVITGNILSKMDKTGTLTQKYQAILPVDSGSQLYSKTDTANLIPWLKRNHNQISGLPTDNPLKGQVLPIEEVYRKLSTLIGLSFPEISKDQERNRGATIHKEACKTLGFSQYLDNGNFPDIPSQLLEIKLQTSQTIDLGKYSPNGEKEIFPGIISNDIRYAIFYATSADGNITIEKLFVVNGEQFFKLCTEIRGINKKIQLPIPHDFFT